MADDKVKVAFVGDDQVSGVITGIRGKLSGLGDIAKTAIGVSLGNALTAIPGLAVKAGKAIVGMVADAAGVEQTRKTFDSLAKSIGETAEVLLGDMRRATRGMVADSDLMLAANKFMSMGLAGSAEEAGKLAEMATQLGMAMGGNATDAMENFALMLANQSIPRLDSFGISSGKVRDRIEELMAATEGMTREQAFMQAVMEQGGVAMERVGEQSAGTAGVMERLKSLFQNLKEGAAGQLVPVLGQLLSPLLDIAENVGPKVIEWAAKAGSWLGGNLPGALSEMKTRATEAWDTLKTKVVEGWEGTAEVRAKISEWYTKFKDETLPQWKEKASEAWGTFKTKVGEWWDNTSETREKIGAWFTTFKDETLPQWKERAIEAWDEFKGKVSDWWDSTAEARQQIVDWYLQFTTVTLPEWATAIEEAADRADSAIKKTVKPAVDELVSTLDTELRQTLVELKEAWDAWIEVEEEWRELYDTYLKPILDALNPTLTLTDTIMGKINTKSEDANKLWGDVKDAFHSAISPIERVKRLFDDVHDALGKVKEAAQWVIDRINDLKNALSSLDLPDWLTPGSPTPFELGLRGIADALKNMPNIGAIFTSGLDLASAPAASVVAGTYGSSGMGSGVVVNNYFGAGSVRSDSDIDEIAERVAEAIDRMQIRRGNRGLGIG